MINPDYLDAQFTLIKEYLSRARAVGRRDEEEFLQDPVFSDAGIRQITVLFETCHNVAKHMIARYGWREAKHKADAFEVLAESGVLSRETADALIQAGRFRNMAVYKASIIDNKTVREILRTRVEDFEQFAAETALWLRDTAPGRSSGASDEMDDAETD